jgi:hypothetical protein
MPHGVLVNQRTKCLSVTVGEGVEGPADELLVWVGHGFPFGSTAAGAYDLPPVATRIGRVVIRDLWRVNASIAIS